MDNNEETDAVKKTVTNVLIKVAKYSFKKILMFALPVIVFFILIASLLRAIFLNATGDVKLKDSMTQNDISSNYVNK